VEQDQHLATERAVDKVVHQTVNNEENTSVHTSVKKEDNTYLANFRSKSSSMASAKAKITAKKASLLAEAADLEERRNLECEELLLLQKKRALEVKVEIAKANAEEQAYSDIEVGGKVTSQTGAMNKYHDANNIMSWKHDIELKSDVHLNPVAHTWQNEPIALKVKIVHQESSISSNLHSSEDILNAIHQGQLQQQRLTEAIQLPNTELQTFDGDPLKYGHF